jgi:FkbM family methyltransferase
MSYTPDEAEKSALRQSGFQPRRYPGVVSVVRRMLWPFVRPFFFHLLARQNEQARRQGDAIESIRSYARNAVPDLPMFAHSLVELRHELAATSKRVAELQIELNASNERADRALSTSQSVGREMERVSDLGEQVVSLRRDRDALGGELIVASKAIVSIRNELAETHRQQRQQENSVSLLVEELREVTVGLASARQSMEPSRIELFIVDQISQKCDRAFAEVGTISGSVKQAMQRIGTLEASALLAGQAVQFGDTLAAGLAQTRLELERVSAEARSQKQLLDVALERTAKLEDGYPEAASALQLSRELENQQRSFSEAAVRLDEQVSRDRLQLESSLRDLEALGQTVGDLRERLNTASAEQEATVARVADQDRSMYELRSSSLPTVFSKLQEVEHRFVSSAETSLVAISSLKGEVQQWSASNRQEISELRQQTAEECSRLWQGLSRAEISTTDLARQMEDGRGLSVVSTPEGVAILPDRDLITRTVKREGYWDRHIIDLMDQLVLPEDGTAIDVGAHMGLITLAMANRFSHVICFEPNDFSCRILKANVELNGMQNVTIQNHGLFSRRQALSLGAGDVQEVELKHSSSGVLDPIAMTNIGGLVFTPNGTGQFEREAVTLDQMNIPSVAFIKIDVQGADGEVLLGAVETLKRCRPVVVFEWEDGLAQNFSVSLSQVRAILRGLGYSCHVLKQHNEKQVDYVAFPAAIAPPRARNN